MSENNLYNIKTEIKFKNHIKRLEKDIAARDPKSEWDNELTKVDAKNIASLREGRVPQYGDHMHALSDDSIDMFEFADLTEEMRGYNPWPEDPAN